MHKNVKNDSALSLLFSANENPLEWWDKEVKNGHIRRIVDDDVKSLVLELSGTNVATTYITCPIKPRASLGIRLPFLVLIVKNMKKYFTFEIQILDDKDMRRRFRVSNFQSTTKVRPFCTTMPIGLSSGWNQIQFNLADFTRRAYGSTYIETMRLQIHANVRIRRIYFADRLYTDDEMPNEFKMFLPSGKKDTKEKEEEKPKEEAKSHKSIEGEKSEVEKLDMGEEAEPSGAPPTPVHEEASSHGEGGGEPIHEGVVEEHVEEVAVGEPDIVESDAQTEATESPEAAVSDAPEDMATPAASEATDEPPESPEGAEPTE